MCFKPALHSHRDFTARFTSQVSRFTSRKTMASTLAKLLGSFTVSFARSARMDAEVAAAAVTICALAVYNYAIVKNKKQIKKKWERRRWWMTEIHRNRTSITMERQLKKLVGEPSEEFEKFTRMSQADFDYLLNQISTKISKQNTQFREAIPARIRLAVTLRYLATGDSFESLHFLFRISPRLIAKIIPEVCLALNDVLGKEVKIPSSANAWLEIEQGFAHKFPRSIGSIDGKHIVIQCPDHSGSEYFNYKKTFSIVLLALVDSNYNFIFADIGSQGRISDGGMFRNSVLWEKNCQNTLNLPTPHPLPGSNKDVPYVFLGDGAFALTKHAMKPYPGNHECGWPKRKFNQNLSSARVVVENTFGILVTRFRIFKKPIRFNPEKVKLLTMTCVLLHNFLRKSTTSSQFYSPPGTVDIYDENDTLMTPGSWRNETEVTGAVRDMIHIPRRPTLNAHEIRDEFTNYFARN